MKDEIFTVFDAAADRFLEPFFSVNAETAMRGFREICSREGHQFNKFPEDYSLFRVGFYDPKTGVISGCTPVKLVNAAAYGKNDSSTNGPRSVNG